MEILINLSDDKVNILNNYRDYQFSNKNGKVAIIINENNFESFLSQAIKNNLPTVVLAGTLKNKDNKVSKLCLEKGLMPQSLVFKNSNTLVDYTEEKVFQTLVPRGVGLNALIELADYAVENNLVAELIIWNPDEAEEVLIVLDDELPEDTKTEKEGKIKDVSKEPPAVTSIEGRQRNSKVERIRPNEREELPKVEENKPVKNTLSNIHKIELSTYMANFDQIILLLRLSENSNNLSVINDLQNKYPATLLEIEKTPSMFSRYASSQEKAIELGDYSFFKDDYVIANPSVKNKILLIDIELLGDFSDLVNGLYESSNKKIFIPSDTYIEEELLVIKDWKNNSLDIDGIIVFDEHMYDVYTKEIGEVAYYHNEIVL